MDLDRIVRRFAGRLSRDFADELARDARAFKKLVLSALRRRLPPYAGRPPELSVTLASDLRKRNVDWQAIYPQCIEGHPTMPALVRRQAEYNLRCAVRSRRKHDCFRLT